jgi:hypothetical protein
LWVATSGSLRPPEELRDELLTRMVPADPDDDVAVIAVRLHPATRTD